MTPTRRAAAPALASLVLALPAAAAPVLPAFDPAAFAPGTAIDNPYFPVLPGQSLAYGGTDADGVTERSVQSYAGAGKTLLGIPTTAVRDRETQDGVLVEETLDYYAQDLAGNVWYFGEDTTNYRYDEEGDFLGTDTDSAWLAGQNGAEPGYIMPSDPEVGFNYYQEFARADEALDQATIFALGQSVTIGLRAFEDVLVTFETTELEPDAAELKYYAPGLGQILVEEDVDQAFQNPELSLELVAIGGPEVAPIPLPAGQPLLAGALAGLAALGRRASRRRA